MDYKPKLKSVKDVFLNDEKPEDEQDDDDDEGLVQHAGGIENVKPVDQVTVEFFEILPAPDTGYILNALPINTTTTTAPNANDSGGVPLGDAMNDTKHMRPSRDLRALQKSHTESKILTEFVNDAAIVQSRKLRTRDNLQNSSKRNGKLDVTITKIHEHFNNSVRGGKIIKRKRSEYRLIPLKTDSPKSRYASSRIASADTNDFALYCSEMKRRRSEGAIFTGDGSSKRTNMRSENPEFKQKHKDFLQQVFRTSKTPDSHNDSTESTSSKSTKLCPRRLNKEPKVVDVATDFQEIMDSGDPDDNLLAIEENSMEKYLKGAWQPPPKEGADSFCWKCHAGRVVHSCSKCIRSFHSSCTKIILLSTHNWVCNECIAVENALHNPKRYRRNEISVDLLSQLLLYVLKIMRCSKVHQSLMQYLESESRYNRYLINSVTFSTLQEKIEKKAFRCAEEFLNETKWILHNVFILTNRRTNKIITAARSLVKTCRQETAEIDACPECYLKAHTRTDWFVDVCAHPHLLVWAKLKGFPYWPAKAMGISQNSLVCVRFFGEHTRALVPVKECYLYSKEDPNSQTGRRAARELAACVQEVEQHIERIKSKVGGFQYPLSKTPYEPNDEMQQLQQMMPGVQEYIKRQQQSTTTKPSLQYKIYKTSDNHLSIVPKANTPDITNTTIDLDPKESSLNTNKKNRAELREDNQPMNDAMILKKPEKLIIKNVPPNYEVITKPITDDNNSSRLSKFILKRKSPAPHELNKSLTSGAKDKLDDTDGQHPMPKLTKWQPANHEASSSSKAEKAPASAETMNRSNGEETKQVKKQDEEQPKQRLPIIILKTNSINISTASDVAGKHQMVRPIVEIKKEVLTGFEDEMNKEAIPTKQQKETTTRPLNPRDSDNQNTMKAKESNTLNIVPAKEVITGDAKLKANAIVTTTITNTTTTTTTTELLPLLCDIKEEVFSDISEESNIVMSEPCNKTYPTAVSNQTNHPPSNSLPNKADLMQMGNNAVSKMLMTSTKTQNNPVISSVGSISYNSNNYGGTTMLSNSKRGTFKGIPYGPLPASAFPPTTAGQGTQPIMKTIGKLTDSGSILQQQPAQVKVGSNRSTHTSQIVQEDKASARGSILQNVNSVISASSTTASSPCLVPLATTVSITLPGTSLQTIDSIHQRGRTANNFVMVNIPVDVATSRIDNSTNSIISSVPALPITAVSKTSPSSTFLTAIAHNGITATVSTTTTATISAISSGNSSSLVTTITPIMSTTNSVPFGLVSNATTVTTTTSSNKTIPCLTNNLTINNSNNNNNNNSSNNNNNNNNNNNINNNNNNTSSNNNIPPPIIATNSNMTNINGANFMPLSLNPLNMRAPPPLAGLSSGNVTAPPAAYSGSTNLMTNYTIPVSKSDSLNGNIFIRSESFPKLLAQPTNQIVMQNDANDSVRTSRFCKKLNENAQKLGEYFRMIMEDTIAQLSQGESPSLEAKIAMLTMELERTKQQHQVELLRAIEETKRKQWCSQCGQEAKLYCCWNTSYCGYPCQKLHWLNHEQSCAQTRNISGDISNTMQAQQIVAAVATTTGASATVATAIVTATSSYNTSTQTHINTIASQLPSYTQQSQQPVPQTRSYITHQQQQQQQQQHQQQQTERHHMVPTTNNTTTATTMNMNKSGITMKKTKVVNKNNNNTQIMSTTSTATPAPTSTHPLATAPIHNTEVLKLPTNTFLRPVTTNAKMNSNQQNNAQQHIRCNTTYSIPVQNYNVPVPITTAPSTYTIVQQGNNWVLRNPGISTLPHQQTKAANSSAVTQTTGVGGNTTRTIRRNGGGRGKLTTLKPKI